MLLSTLLLCALGASSAAPLSGPLLGNEATFDTHFTGATLRFDYHHCGDATHEQIAPDGLRVEGPWPGSRTQLVDDTNLGKYLLEIVDPTTNGVVYSRGFASIYGEWETTGEARRQWRSIHESVRFPEPREPVLLVLKKRSTDGTFRELFAQRMDPHTHFVDRSALPRTGEVVSILESGPAATKVDLLVLGEGYTAGEADKFRSDLERLAGVFLEFEPFKSRSSDFNIRGLHVPSDESGISNPRKDVWRASPLGLSFNAFDSDRYVLTFANRRLREAAAQAPYDTLILLFNDRKYGGGGIFGLWSTCAADSSEAAYLFVHEFGHSFAGLADEYYTSQVSYEDFNREGVEPWEPNITALQDPEHIKWGDLVAADTPIPTPWNQARYDEASLAYQARRAELRARGASEEEAEALFDEVRALTGPMLRAEPHFRAVGAFEGGGYRAKGIWRPQADCIMFTRNPDTFCQVCARGLERVIDLYAH